MKKTKRSKKASSKKHAPVLTASRFDDSEKIYYLDSVLKASYSIPQKKAGVLSLFRVFLSDGGSLEEDISFLEQHYVEDLMMHYYFRSVYRSSKRISLGLIESISYHLDLCIKLISVFYLDHGHIYSKRNNLARGPDRNEAEIRRLDGEITEAESALKIVLDLRNKMDVLLTVARSKNKVRQLTSVYRQHLIARNYLLPRYSAKSVDALIFDVHNHVFEQDPLNSAAVLTSALSKFKEIEKNGDCSRIL